MYTLLCKVGLHEVRLNPEKVKLKQTSEKSVKLNLDPDIIFLSFLNLDLDLIFLCSDIYLDPVISFSLDPDLDLG